MSDKAKILAELEAATSEHHELNTSNYGHDDVYQVNDWAIGAREVMERAALHIRSLTERLEKAEKDAARYRWLRRSDEGVGDELCTALLHEYGDEFLDEVIDAAIAQEGTGHE